jgi:hypothetical protein
MDAASMDAASRERKRPELAHGAILGVPGIAGGSANGTRCWQSPKFSETFPQRPHAAGRAWGACNQSLSHPRKTPAARTFPADGAGPGELVQVTRDQVSAWDPDAIVTNNPEFLQTCQTPGWANFGAVAQGRVYLAPSLPFGWIDEPPSVNRLLGLLWLGQKLYPAVYTDDLNAEARSFYRRFYRIELDDEQLHALLP